MKLSCPHCGEEFSITAAQLGTRGRCPHCRASITLPRADEATETASEPLVAPSHLVDNLICGLGSCVVHLVILVLLGLVRWGSSAEIGPGDEAEVWVGELPFQNLTDAMDQSLDLESSIDSATESDSTETFEEFTPQEFSADDFASDPAELSASSGLSFGSAQEFSDSQARRATSGGGEDFDGLIQRLRRDGLDIVIVFDSTGSMSGEIDQVKSQIQRIGTVLLKMVPKSRISICTYRDEQDEYLVKGQELGSSIESAGLFLQDIRAAGGGDHPEAVHAGLNWAVSNNQFRPRARKVILLFGDAPPHRQFLSQCLSTAETFRDQQGGIVSTVTCRATRRMDEFVEIAQAGGGEAFLTSNEREIMTQLIVLVFGSKHRAKVLEAFEMLEE